MRLSIVNAATSHYRLVVLGGGTAGTAVSNNFRKLIPKGQMAVIEPFKDHYYQPGFTLVGGGFKTLDTMVRPTASYLNPDAVWIQQAAEELQPKNNAIVLADGSVVKYDYLVVTTGLRLRFDKVEGLTEALKTQGVFTIYVPHLAQKTNTELRAYRGGGNAIFTFPNTPIKCAGAPQKICYLADEIFRQNGVRDTTTIYYNTTLGRVFGVLKYAEELAKIIEKKGIKLNLRRNLIKVDPITRTAVFQVIDDCCMPTGKTETYKYDLLHVGPPCSAVPVLEKCKELTADGWLDVDKHTLQSTRFPNVMGAGDCLNTPTAKTGASISTQVKVLKKNLPALMKGQPLPASYDGYASCPLMVSMNRVILAEFNYDGPIETFPINQAKPTRLGFWCKRYILPFLYWDFLLKGRWHGPATIRKIVHLGFSK